MHAAMGAQTVLMYWSFHSGLSSPRLLQVLHGLRPVKLVSKAWDAAASCVPIRLLRVHLRKLCAPHRPAHQQRLRIVLDSINTPVIKVQWVLPDSQDDKAAGMLCDWIKTCKNPETVQKLKVFEYGQLPLDSDAAAASKRLPACQLLILPNR